jgi:hypothetical protein
MSDRKTKLFITIYGIVSAIIGYVFYTVSTKTIFFELPTLRGIFVGLIGFVFWPVLFIFALIGSAYMNLVEYISEQ